MRGIIDGIQETDKKPNKGLNLPSMNLEGEEILKNITYRPKEQRYYGRKQINNHIIQVYDKSYKNCLWKLRQKVKQAKLGLLETKDLTLKKGTGLTLKQYWDKWYKQNKEPFVSIGTNKDLIMIDKKLTPLHNTPIRSITKDVVLKFLNEVEENRSKEKLILYFKACLAFAVKEDIIKKNPFDTIILKHKANIRKEGLTYEQQKTLLTELDKHEIKPIILFYIITGIRKNELERYALLENIDKENVLKILNLKGRNLERRYKKIKLTQTMVDYIKENINIFLKYNNEQTYREFREIVRGLGWQNISIVNLRHTCATNKYFLKIPDLIISREMGHSKNSTLTKDVYTDVDYNLNAEKIKKLYPDLYYLYE